MKQKVVFCIRAITGEGGGAERVFAQVVNALRHRGKQVQVLAFDTQARPFYDLEQTPVSFLSILRPNRSMGLIQFVRLLFRIRDYLRRERPQVVVAFMHSAYIPILIASLGLKIRVIASEHADYGLYKSKVLQGWINTFFCRLAWKKTVPSESQLPYYSAAEQKK
ncbi:MAG: glycosyltransferase family 4 protein [Limnobacter sp.]|nr:glycosyltransferase family 4 protein [Limnobacter sp.]